MKIINRYIIKNHIAPFILGSATVVFLFLFQFLLRYIERLLGKGLDTWIIIQLIGYNLSWMIVFAVPMGILFSTLMAFGSMSASQEITIIKASGGSLIKMMFPMIIFGFISFYLMFEFNDKVLPEANHRAKLLLNDISRKKPTFAIEKGQFSTQLDGYTILARDLDSSSGAMKGITIYDNTGNRTRNIISADSGFLKFDAYRSRMVMDLIKGEIIQYSENTVNNMRKIDFDSYNISIRASGFDLERSQEDPSNKGDREMTIAEMQTMIDEAVVNNEKINIRLDERLNKHLDYILLGDTFFSSNDSTLSDSANTNKAVTNIQRNVNILRSSLFADLQMKREYDLQDKKYSVEIHKKYAIPFACFIFVFVGCPLGVMTRGGNFGISAAISLGFYILYWAFLMGGEKMADRGMVSPFMSMWLGNFIVGGLGLILTIKVQNENFSLLKYFKYKLTKPLFANKQE